LAYRDDDAALLAGIFIANAIVLPPYPLIIQSSSNTFATRCQRRTEKIMKYTYIYLISAHWASVCGGEVEIFHHRCSRRRRRRNNYYTLIVMTIRGFWKIKHIERGKTALRNERNRRRTGEKYDNNNVGWCTCGNK
jgi:hypothetical protein